MTANSISQIALPPAIFLTDKFSPQKINIIFGRNGTGKSTIANLFYHTDSFTFSENNAGEDCEFFIFDKQFIELNIQHYAGMPGIVTVSTQNAELLREQKALKEQLQEKEADIRILTDMISSLDKACSDSDEQFRENCWRKTKDLRKEFEMALSGKKTKQKFAEACVCISPQQQDKMKLSQLYDAVFISEIKPFPFYYMIPDTMGLDHIDEAGLLGTPLLGSGDSLFSAFMKKMHAVDWVKNGHTNFLHKAGNICPYCQQALPDDFEEQLAACFDDAYKRSLDDLQKFLERYRRAANEMFIPLQNNLKEYSRFEKADHARLISLMKLLKQIISINIEKIRKKIESPSSVITPEPTHELMEQINTEIAAINTEIENYNKIAVNIKNAQETCKNNIMAYIAYCLQNEIREYKIQKEQLSAKKHTYTAKLKNLQESCRIISDQLVQIENLITNTADAVTHINALLSKAGFTGFSLRQSTRYDHTYEVIRENGALVSQLSEGEQRFLAFLYFYDLLGSELKGNTKRIAVIDDPFTGLDRETANIVIAMLKKLIRSETIAQLFILTHRRDCYSILAEIHDKNNRPPVLWILNKIKNHTIIQRSSKNYGS